MADPRVPLAPSTDRNIIPNTRDISVKYATFVKLALQRAEYGCSYPDDYLSILERNGEDTLALSVDGDEEVGIDRVERLLEALVQQCLHRSRKAKTRCWFLSISCMLNHVSHAMHW